MIAHLRKIAYRFLQRTAPARPTATALEVQLLGEVEALRAREQLREADNRERLYEIVEARQMAGSGPWLMQESRDSVTRGGKFKEADPMLTQGATGDIELALQNVEWRREVNLSWMEFSRWGIQQIILISRLYYIKNPIVRRLVNVCADYVFARGVEVMSDDETANETLKEFFERNGKTLGNVALGQHERSKDTDGNLFFVLFPDAANSGRVAIRTIDATEIADIICNPDDADEPWYYRRVWSQRNFDPATGATRTEQMEAWYPAIGYDPADKPPQINKQPVRWDAPVYHRKCGGVAKWHFGCPRVYPMIDWSRESRRFLEACASVRQSLSQIAMVLTTKGGQQAIMGAKQQLQTTVGPTSTLWDTNPTANTASIFASGPGTTLEAFKTQGSGFDPEGVRQYKLMCCMVKGVPETFLADVSTGNLATATSLDRPTETAMLALQEEWIEDLTVIATYVLNVSRRAPSGKLREAKKEGANVIAWPRAQAPDGRNVYEARKPVAGQIAVRVNFPAIREGDVPALVTAVVQATTLGTREIAGIDAKAAVRKLYDLLGIEGGDELAEEQFPEGTYEPDRTIEEPEDPEPEPNPKKAAEALRRATERLGRAVERAANLPA